MEYFTSYTYTYFVFDLRTLDFYKQAIVDLGFTLKYLKNQFRACRFAQSECLETQN